MHRNIGSFTFPVDKRAVDNYNTIGLYIIDELVIRRAVHRNEHIRSDNEGRADGIGGDADAAVCRAASHGCAVCCAYWSVLCW